MLWCVNQRIRLTFKCNYHGYRDALESGNFTYYLENTVPGRRGSMENCWEKDIVIAN